MSDDGIDAFPLRTFEKIRYADTDRQGHVNNAVFATLFESGRVEILYDPNAPLADTGCAFVIARLTIEFLREIHWPGDASVGTRVAKIGRSSLDLEQAVFQDGVRVAKAQSVIVQMNESTRRSHPLSPRAIERLAQLTV